MESEALDRLVVAAQDGDREALHQALRQVIPPLRLSIAARVPQIDWIEEILQETLLAAIEHLGDYRPEGTFLPWLRGIARHSILRELRRRQRLREHGGELEGILERHALARVEAEQGDSLAAEVRDEALQRMQHCMERLSPRARSLLLRRHQEDVPLARLAQQFKQSAGAIAASLKRIRRSLRDCVEQAHA